MAEYFGLRGRRLLPTILTLHVLKNADHTLSAHWARKRLRQSIAWYMHQRFRVIINGYPDICGERAPRWDSSTDRGVSRELADEETGDCTGRVDSPWGNRVRVEKQLRFSVALDSRGSAMKIRYCVD